MNTTYVKLFRKLKDHEIMLDSVGLQIFIWILISVDHKTGTMKSGRFWGSGQLGLKPRTFHKALTERLAKKYHLVTLISDNKKTIISVNKWRQYQNTSDTSRDNKVTTKGQQSDTTQEIKEIKEIKEYTSMLLNWWNENIATDKLTGKTGKKYNPDSRAARQLDNNLSYWMEQYSLEEIKKAAVYGYYEDGFKGFLTPTILLRRRNTAQEPVDYIHNLLKGYERTRKKDGV